MTTRMSDAESWAADWMRLSKLCKRMAEEWPTYARLAAMPSTALDGYGAGGSGQGRAKGTHADPVLALIERKEGCPVDERGEPLPVRITADQWVDAEVDRINDLVNRLYDECVVMVNTARRIEGLKRLIDNRGDARYGRQSSVTDCLCCEATVTGVGEDRIKAGYCPACYKAWERYRAQVTEPVHELFRRHRRVELAAETERAS